MDNAESAEIQEPIFINGMVNTDVLNVHEEPKENSEVLGIIDRTTNVLIDDAESTEDFYKICTETGLEGFCVKQFITV